MKNNQQVPQDLYTHEFVKLIGREPKGNERWLLNRSLDRDEAISKIKAIKEREEMIRRNTPLWIKQGEELKRRRLQLKLSLKHIADQVRVSPSTISKIEKGKPIRHPHLVVNGFRNVLKFEEEKVKNFAMELKLKDCN